MIATVVNERIASAFAKSIDFGAKIDPARISDVPWLLAEAVGNLADNALTYDVGPDGEDTIVKLRFPDPEAGKAV